MAFQPFDPREEVRVHRQNLPHWRQWGATYFVTSRLADSAPAHLSAEWRRERDLWLRAHGVRFPEDLPALSEESRHEYHRAFTAKFHALLDAGHGACPLARRECADALIARLIAGHGKAYELDAWCIMPNHLHALVEPAPQITLGEIVRHWKGGSAFEINRIVARRGKLWQAEPFDHIVRSEEQWQHFRRYIALNPQKAGLRDGFVLGFGAQARVTPRVVMGFSP